MGQEGQRVANPPQVSNLPHTELTLRGEHKGEG